MKIEKRYKKKIILNFTINIFKKLNLSRSNANLVAKHLLRADERGVWSHGIVRLPIYTERLEKKVANPSSFFWD